MADVEQMLVNWLPQQIPGVRTCTETPAEKEFTAAVQGGLVRVVRVGGGRQRAMEALDAPRLVLDCFKLTRPDAKQLALDVANALFLRLPGTTVGNGVIGRVVEVSGPSWAPWDNTTVRRFVAIYQLFVKNAS